MLRVGLIGLGFMGKVHLAAYEKLRGAEVVAVADNDPKRAAGDLSAGGADNIETDTVEQLDMTKIKGTTDPHELIGFDDVDIVDVCVPTPFHTDIVIAALASGKHVLCEKPMARTSAEARRIAEAAAAATGLFMPAMCMRFWPQWKWLRHVIEDGRYGKVVGATFRRGGQMPGGWFGNGEWSGGALLDLHIHDSDFIFHLFGRPDAVASQGYAKTSGEIDHIVTQYHYRGGPKVVSAEGLWCMADGAGFRMLYTVNFENATADFDIGRDDPLIVWADGKSEPISVDGTDGYEGELEYFVDCVRKGKTPSLVTAEDAVTSIEIVEAEARSIATGEVVKL